MHNDQDQGQETINNTLYTIIENLLPERFSWGQLDKLLITAFNNVFINNKITIRPRFNETAFCRYKQWN